MLVSVGLTVLLMSILAEVFAVVSGTVRLERTLREVDQKVRSAQAVLKDDLDGVTVVMHPPRDPADGEGYFEYEENTTVAEWDQYRVTVIGGQEVTGADTDDVIQFTTRVRKGEHRPFVGRGVKWQLNSTTGQFEQVPAIVESEVAEVSYFLRESQPRSGTTPVLYNLYRRQLLVDAEQPLPPALRGSYRSDASWYWQYDLSARPNRVNAVGLSSSAGGLPLINRLGDLTLRENRFAHNPLLNQLRSVWPHRPISFEDIDNNGIYNPGAGGDVITTAPLRITWFGRPLLRETADFDWNSPVSYPPTNVPYPDPTIGTEPVDSNNDGLMEGVGGVVFTSPLPSPPSTGDRPRYGEDILLTNVLSFDVEAWDPGAPIFETFDVASGRPIDLVEPGHPQYTLIQNVAGVRIAGFGAYADLGYGLPPWVQAPAVYNTLPQGVFFWHDGDRRVNGLRLRRTYDTWANYDNDGFDNQRTPPLGLAAEVGSPTDPITGRAIADGIDNNGDGAIDEGIDDGFNGADDDGDQVFFANNGIDEDQDGLVDDPDEWINETHVTAGPGYDDWIDNDGINGGGVGQALDPGELFEAEAPPPYPVPLSGIRIRIRVLEPASRQTREFTLIHSFRTE